MYQTTNDLFKVLSPLVGKSAILYIEYTGERRQMQTIGVFQNADMISLRIIITRGPDKLHIRTESVTKVNLLTPERVASILNACLGSQGLLSGSLKKIARDYGDPLFPTIPATH